MGSSVAQETFAELTALEQQIKSLGVFPNKENRLEQRVNALEEKLLQLEQQSLERAKLGMEQLAKKYLPKLLAVSCAGLAAANRNLVDSHAPAESDLGGGVQA